MPLTSGTNQAPTTILGPIGAPRLNRGALAPLGTTNPLAGIAVQAEESLTNKRVIQAAEAAGAAEIERDPNTGLATLPESQGNFTVFDQAYNKAMRAKYISELGADTADSLDKIFVKHDKGEISLADATGQVSVYIESLGDNVDPIIRNVVVEHARSLARQLTRPAQRKEIEKNLAEAQRVAQQSVRTIINDANAGDIPLDINSVKEEVFKTFADAFPYQKEKVENFTRIALQEVTQDRLISNLYKLSSIDRIASLRDFMKTGKIGAGLARDSKERTQLQSVINAMGGEEKRKLSTLLRSLHKAEEKFQDEKTRIQASAITSDVNETRLNNIVSFYNISDADPNATGENPSSVQDYLNGVHSIRALLDDPESRFDSKAIGRLIDNLDTSTQNNLALSPEQINYQRQMLGQMLVYAKASGMEEQDLKAYNILEGKINRIIRDGSLSEIRQNTKNLEDALRLFKSTDAAKDLKKEEANTKILVDEIIGIDRQAANETVNGALRIYGRGGFEQITEDYLTSEPGDKTISLLFNNIGKENKFGDTVLEELEKLENWDSFSPAAKYRLFKTKLDTYKLSILKLLKNKAIQRKDDFTEKALRNYILQRAPAGFTASQDLRVLSEDLEAPPGEINILLKAEIADYNRTKKEFDKAQKVFSSFYRNLSEGESHDLLPQTLENKAHAANFIRLFKPEGGEIRWLSPKNILLASKIGVLPQETLNAIETGFLSKNRQVMIGAYSAWATLKQSNYVLDALNKGIGSRAKKLLNMYDKDSSDHNLEHIIKLQDTGAPAGEAQKTTDLLFTREEAANFKSPAHRTIAEKQKLTELYEKAITDIAGLGATTASSRPWWAHALPVGTLSDTEVRTGNATRLLNNTEFKEKVVSYFLRWGEDEIPEGKPLPDKDAVQEIFNKAFKAVAEQGGWGISKVAIRSTPDNPAWVESPWETVVAVPTELGQPVDNTSSDWAMKYTLDQVNTKVMRDEKWGGQGIGGYIEELATGVTKMVKGEPSSTNKDTKHYRYKAEDIRLVRHGENPLSFAVIAVNPNDPTQRVFLHDNNQKPIVIDYTEAKEDEIARVKSESETWAKIKELAAINAAQLYIRHPNDAKAHAKAIARDKAEEAQAMRDQMLQNLRALEHHSLTSFASIDADKKTPVALDEISP